jgi:hypothetical protein
MRVLYWQKLSRQMITNLTSRREKFPHNVIHEGSTRPWQMEKYKFIGYEHCSTILILKVKKYALAELIFS